MITQEIIEEFALGSHDAFRRIFQLFYPKVYAFIQGMVKEKEETEDLAQTVFIKLWDKRTIFLEVRHFDSYLFALTKHIVLNHISSKRLVRLTESNDEELGMPEADTPYDTLVAKDLQLLIDMVVGEMPPKRRQIYRYSRVEGWSNDKIAEKMGIRKKTVENHLNIALNELRKVLLIITLVNLIPGA